MDEEVIEESKHSNGSEAASKEVTEEVKKGGAEATKSKELTEDKEADDKPKEGTGSRGTEEDYSNIGSPQKDVDELTSTGAKKLIDEDNEGQDIPPKDATDNGIIPNECSSVTTSPIQGILVVKLKAKMSTQSAITEIRPKIIGVAQRRKSITLNVSEKDLKKTDQAKEVPRKAKIDFDPVDTTRFFDSKNEDKTEEAEAISPGRELLREIESKLQGDIKFTPKRGDQHRSSFRHQQTVGRIAENSEWHLDADDVRYGVHRTYSDQPPQEEPGAWDIFKVVVMDLCCCCCCGSPPDPYYIEEDEVETYQQPTQQEEMEDISFNQNARSDRKEEAKPKRVGRMKRIRRFFKRLLCCTAGSRED